MGSRVRIGYGLGTQVGLDGDGFQVLVQGLETLGFDSLWLSERLTGPGPDPLVALAVAAGCTRRLKLGTSVLVLPGRNPAVVASQLASLDRLSGGRLLPAVGLGAPDEGEHRAFGVRREERGAWFDEVLPLIRRLWSGEAVDHDGPRFSFRGLQVRPTPVQSPLEVWLGGRSPVELRRVGRLGDGWLPSFCTPADVAAGRKVVEEAAAAAGRTIDPGHFGALVAYVRDGERLPDRTFAAISARLPGVDPLAVVPVGTAAVRELLSAFVEAGATKFVLTPVSEPASWREELENLAAGVLALQV
ncbi:MAG: TIGR03619 family F420-dependent LLM class oxidoreductase [Acidimicrobiales bacterium]